MIFLPITIDTLHENQIDCLIVEGTMTRDFGPWLKGEERCLTFNFEKGTVTDFDDEGVAIVSVELELIAK